MKRIYPYIQLILSIAFVFLLILSDFGVAFPTENTDMRILLHCSAILLLLSSVIQLRHTKL